jgi:chaperonin cofactor prefoldin
MELSELKAKILALLKVDEEFRYAVAGMIGYDEILKRLQKHDEKFEEILAQIKEIRESQNRLENRVGSLEKSVNSLEKRVGSLEKSVNSLDKRVGSLEERVDSLASAMIAGFAEIGKFAGITFEEFVRKFLTASLKKLGQIPQGAELTRTLIDGEEVDIFLEDPLIVGEVTAHAETAQEVQKLIRKAELAKTRYAKEPRKVLVILTAKREAAREIEKIAKEKNVELIIGRIVD